MTTAIWRIVWETNTGHTGVSLWNRGHYDEARAERTAIAALGRETPNGTICRTVVEIPNGDEWRQVNEFEF